VSDEVGVPCIGVEAVGETWDDREIQMNIAYVDVGLTDDTIARMLAWRAENPEDKHGTHGYDGAKFGITESGLASRFGTYRERFGPLLSGTVRD
jgi:hypothetical protein